MRRPFKAIVLKSFSTRLRPRPRAAGGLRRTEPTASSTPAKSRPRVRRHWRSRLPPLVLLAALGLACCASTSAGLRTRTTDAPGDIQGIEIEHSYTLEADGTWRRHLREQLRVVTEHGLDEIGDPRFVHHSGAERLEVMRAETTMRDGKVVAIKPNSVTETTPDALATAPAYADLRETVVTRVGLELGASTLLELERSGRGQAAPLWAEVPLHHWYPVDSLKIRIAVPADLPLRWACLGCEARPIEESAGDGAVLRFEFKDLPALNLDEAAHGPTAPPGQPRLVFSTAASWRSLVDDLATRFASASAPDEAVRQRALQLTERLATDAQRIEALHLFVARELATVHWPLDDFGWQPRSASAVLDSSYGHALDKAVLLAALLAAIDLPAMPALISRDALVAPGVPTLAPFDEVWLVLEHNGRPRWLDPTALHSGAALARREGRWVLPVQRSEAKPPRVLIARSPLVLGKPMPVKLGPTALAANRSALVAELTLAADGALTAELDLTLAGAYSPAKPAGKELDGAKLAKSAIGNLGLPEAYPLDCEGCASKVVQLARDSARFVASSKSQAAGAEQLVELHLPWTARSQLTGLDLHRSKRDLALELGWRGVEQSTVILHLPEGLELRSKLPAAELRNEVGSLVTTTTRSGDTLTLTRTLQLDRRVISPAQYPALRALAAELLRADHRALLFVEDDKKTAGKPE